MKFRQQKNENLGYQIIAGIFILIQILILVNILMFSDSTVYTTKQTFLFPNRVLFIIGIAVCAIVYFLIGSNNKYAKVKQKTVHIWLFSASVLLFVLQLIILFNMYFLSGWDAGGIRSSVFEIVNGTYNIWYDYSRFTQNINMTAGMVLIVKLFVYLGLDGYSGCLIVSALLVNLSGVFTFLSTYNITRSLRYAIFSWITFVFLVALSPWISIPYSDTYSILFSSLAFYLYVSRKPEKKNYARWFWIGFLCLFGYTIKPTAIIVLIAIILIESWKVISNFDKKVLCHLLFSLIMIAFAAVPVYWISTSSRNLLGIELDKNRKDSIYLLVMVGLNADSDGAYSNDDVLFSMPFDTVRERNAANIEVIKDRLTDFGIFGYLKHLEKKALVNFSDGSFDWSGEGNFYQEIPERKGEFASFLKNLYYRGGTYHMYFLTFEQLLWFVVLLLLSVLSLPDKSPDYKKTIVMLAIIGVSAVVMLFEARARYLYSYSPFYIVGASIGLRQIVQKAKGQKASKI